MRKFPKSVHWTRWWAMMKPWVMDSIGRQKLWKKKNGDMGKGDRCQLCQQVVHGAETGLRFQWDLPASLRSWGDDVIKRNTGGKRKSNVMAKGSFFKNKKLKKNYYTASPWTILATASLPSLLLVREANLLPWQPKTRKWGEEVRIPYSSWACEAHWDDNLW